ncbi:MAG: hypothetical protein OXH19_13135 [Chloroflexi bacterium]|nr:hypothetical protein [Chloroflexota bacterium]MCY3587656.1 hypothetical protein [Chloroflexota bacterium]MCY3684555.1 hypothetical protein [Chloroflexota bacterium]
MDRDTLDTTCGSVKGEAMEKVLQQQVTVLPGGKVEVVCPELDAGQVVDVVVLRDLVGSRRPITEIINDGPGKRLFRTAKEVDDYLAEERASWDR